jgi:hypothetical protein
MDPPGAALCDHRAGVAACAINARDHAFSELLHILWNGEESAALAFAVLGRRRQRVGDREALTSALTRIAAEEREHESLLRESLSWLPAPQPDDSFSLATKRFFRGLASNDAGVHFTRIAALDSAVCLLLATLRRSQPQLFGRALGRILADEGRHVAVAGDYSRWLLTPARRTETADETRAALTRLLLQRADCLETLRMDPDALFIRLRQPPRCLRQ